MAPRNMNRAQDVHLMTDRTSHMRYLESQLERMNAACSKFSSFDCRLEDMRGQVTMLQDKVINLARMLDAHSHSVVNTAAEIRETATDVSKKQQIVHDLLFGGRSEKVCCISVAHRIHCQRSPSTLKKCLVRIIQFCHVT